MQIWAESGNLALPICNYLQILYQFLAFTQNLKRSQCSWQQNLILFHCTLDGMRFTINTGCFFILFSLGLFIFGS